MQQKAQQQTSATQVIVLVLIAVVLAVAYFALDRYSEGEKYVAMTESRGTQIIRGLAKHKLESGSYPEALDKLAPKFVAAIPQCPSGEAFAYAVSGGEYTLSCRKVLYTINPYGYDSRTRAWRG